jgi:broad specificity phosphatase PhoE
MIRQNVFALACLVAAANAVPSRVAAQSPTVVIVVRHGEKAAAPANDPPLTDAGTARAAALAAALADANVAAVLTTPLLRTRETARPLAQARGLTLETVALPAAGRPIAEHGKAVADAVRKHAGQTVLVVGHSNTVAAIIAALGGPAIPDLCDSEYSDLFTLVLDGTRARLIRGSYGTPSTEHAPACSNAMK